MDSDTAVNRRNDCFLTAVAHVLCSFLPFP